MAAATKIIATAKTKETLNGQNSQKHQPFKLKRKEIRFHPRVSMENERRKSTTFNKYRSMAKNDFEATLKKSKVAKMQRERNNTDDKFQQTRKKERERNKERK